MNAFTINLKTLIALTVAIGISITVYANSAFDNEKINVEWSLVAGEYLGPNGDAYRLIPAGNKLYYVYNNGPKRVLEPLGDNQFKLQKSPSWLKVDITTKPKQLIFYASENAVPVTAFNTNRLRPLSQARPKFNAP
ncbi:hypothetical protein [Flocculibacter collagenilyticus]|uniref:hypothetical protein n=1 Tax=Flocculibacter collagenilyticus TaxID=2744479 RepID=UPI0018F3357F|nr:hypothetical protein [Flocculibacter collagenilyticus]